MGAIATKREKNLNGYWTLIRQFPLCPIRKESEFKKAVKVMRTLALKGLKRSAGETDYLFVLGRLISEYERSKPSIQKLLKEASEISSVEMLKFIMEENKLTQTKLAQETGLDQGNISAFLAGRRKLSSAAAVKLAKRFHVSADIFLAS